jgi:hypothetical protein
MTPSDRIETPTEITASRAECGEGLCLTLLDLVTALVETGAGDSEVVAAVRNLVGSHRVRLVGVICDTDVLGDVA